MARSAFLEQQLKGELDLKSRGWLVAQPLVLYVFFALFVLTFYWFSNAISPNWLWGTFLKPYHLRVTAFTLYQGMLGSLLCVLTALLLLGTLYKIRHTLWGKIVRNVVDIPFFLPSIVGCLAVVLVFGQNSVLSWFFGLLGLRYQTFLYGINGILLCYVFYYTPYVLRVFFQALDALPQAYEKLALAFGMGYVQRLKWVYYPIVYKEVARSLFFVFMQCLRGFTIVLMFGGFPSSTTLEVGIYQALQFEMDWVTAFKFALIQLCLSTSCFSLFGMNAFRLKTTSGSKVLPPSAPMSRVWEPLSFKDVLCLGVVLLLFALPLIQTALQGLKGLFQVFFEPIVWEGIGVSLLLGLFSALLGIVCVFFVVHFSYTFEKRGKKKLAFLVGEFGGNLSLFFSPLLIVSFFFFLFINHLKYFWESILLISCLNAFCFFPVLYNTSYFHYKEHRKSYDSLCASLGIRGRWRFFYIDLPALKGVLGYALSVCFILAMGDVKIILFFGSQRIHTLTSLLYDKMQGYQFQEAAGLGCILLVLSFFFSRFFEHVLRKG